MAISPLQSAVRDIFDAAFLDTNVLRAAGLNLSSSPWFQKIHELCVGSGIVLGVAELSVDEWTSYHHELTRQKRAELQSAASMVNTFSPTSVNLGKLVERSAVKERLTAILAAADIEIVPTAPSQVGEYLKDAVTKVPPFDEDGKGFVDAAILDSLGVFASTRFPGGRIIVVTNDKAIHDSADRFVPHEVRVEFARREDAYDRITSSLSDANQRFVRERDKALLELAQAHEKEILASLKGRDISFGALTFYGDPKLANAERITGVRPKKVGSASVLFGIPEAVVGINRYRVSVSVVCDVDIVVKDSTMGSILGSMRETKVSLEDLEKGKEVPVKSYTFSPPTERRTTVELSTSIDGSIDRSEFDQGVAKEFRLEPELSKEQWSAVVELVRKEK